MTECIPGFKTSNVAVRYKKGSPTKLELPFEYSNRKALSASISSAREDNSFFIFGTTFFLYTVA